MHSSNRIKNISLKHDVFTRTNINNLYLSMIPKVTGKFQGGVNPFTRGCCNNLEYLVCSPISPKWETFFFLSTLSSAFQETIKLTVRLSRYTRYTARPREKTAIHIQPPFLRPGINRQLPAKVRDNGIQSQDVQNKVGIISKMYSSNLL